MSSPDQIRRQIEQTRSELSHDVNTLADTVSPSAMARRQTDKVRGAARSVRERVMGVASSGHSGMASAASGAGSAASDVGSAVSNAPSAVMDRTAGNPLAAGIIAFGAGWLLSSMLPASDPERKAADNVKSAAMPTISDAAKEVAQDVKEQASVAVDSVQSSATEAAQAVKDESTSAAQDLQSQARDAQSAVQDSAGSSSPQGSGPST